MKKKIIVAIVVIFLILIAGGGFFWWQNQKDVRELNKKLPEGIRVVKSLLEEYKVVNKIDGYEFKVPREWRGISEIEYIPERTEEGYTGTSISIEGELGGSRIFTIDHYKLEKTDMDLLPWAKNIFNTFTLIGNFSKDTVGKFNVVKTQENAHLLGMYVYFFKKESTVYVITNGSEEFIKYIITNGKW